MKKKRWILLAVMVLLLCLGSTTAVYAAKNVSQSQTNVKVTSSKKGWQRIGGSWYYYASNGRMQCGMIRYKGNYYYCRPNGKMVTGWFQNTRSKKWYYFNGSGVMARNGWKSLGGKWYYFQKNGVMYKGWLKLGNTWYYLGSNGAMYKGWRSVGGKKYYFDSSGRMAASKWLKYNDGWYYVGSSGAQLRSSWLKLDGKWYYLGKYGKMVTGWCSIGGKKYYFYSSGVMAASTWIGNYYVGSDGAMTPANWQDNQGNQLIYSSGTLHVEAKKSTMNGHPYWVARVRTASPKQLRSALSFGTYGGTRQNTTNAVPANGGIIGVNGSAFDYATGIPSPRGMCIKNGKIYGDYMTSYTVFAVKNDGTMFTPRQGLMGRDLLNMGVKDTYNFGPVLINNGNAQPSIAETNKQYPRTAVGMVKKNDYVLLVTDNGYSGLNHWELVKIFQSFGCQYAYNLDGGGSSTMYFNGKRLNTPAAGSERACADFLYFTN
ncbi:MAG: phosphodiester glycosidase family protein [Blautia sp.]|jgi:glucan-binding YG repeat protein